MAEIYGPVDPIYYPQYQIITAITKAKPTAVTTAQNHGYTTGMVVRIVVPIPYMLNMIRYNFGMPQINGLSSSITVTGPDSFTLDGIDSTTFDSFSTPVGVGQMAQCLPIGENTAIVLHNGMNILADATYNTL